MAPPTTHSSNRPVFYVGLALIPILLLLLLEGGLRLVWTPEESRGLFIPDPFNDQYLVVNQAVGRLYFSGTSFGAFGTQDAFLKTKPDNGLRIFVLGGSTTAGYPTLYSGSFPAMLRARLTALYPDRTVEVINLGMTAVNTYTVRDFARECLRYQPDALILYTGHNEFYGALGTGSSQQPFWGSGRQLTLAYLQLKKLRLFRLWSAVLTQLQARKPKPPSQTLMAQMAREQTIPLHSPLYSQTVDIFRQNLDDILRWTQDAQVPVILGTLVSNLKDQPPFVSISPAGKSAKAILDQVRLLTEGKDPLRRSAILDSLQRQYPSLAGLAFQAAQVDTQLKRWDQAREKFIRAKDLDGLRFRAPSDFNTVIRTLAATYPHARVAPIDSFFTAASPHQLIGHTLIWEHLHPNLDGYFLMGKGFAKTVTSLFPPSKTTVNDDSLYTAMAVSALDSSLARYRLDILMAGWPFNPEGRFKTIQDLHADTFEDSLALSVLKRDSNYEKAHVAAARHYVKTGQWRRAVREYRILAETFHQNESPWLALGRLYIQHRNFDDALPVLETTLRLTDDPFSAKWAGTIWLERGAASRALRYLKQARRRLPRDPQLLYNLSGAYFLTGDTANALTTIEATLRLAPKDPAAQAFHRKLVTARSRP